MRDEYQVPLPEDSAWYHEAAAQKGSAATLLGLRLDGLQKDGELYWRALAVGDTCLFVIRGDTLLCSFPLVSAEQFDDRPNLVSTSGKRHLTGDREVRVAGGRVETGDYFLLATDALAEWILRAKEQATKVVKLLRRIDSKGLESLVRELQRGGAMRLDDVTLARVFVLENAEGEGVRNHAKGEGARNHAKGLRERSRGRVRSSGAWLARPRRQ